MTRSRRNLPPRRPLGDAHAGHAGHADAAGCGDFVYFPHAQSTRNAEIVGIFQEVGITSSRGPVVIQLWPFISYKWL